jgi:hypothetical protein
MDGVKLHRKLPREEDLPMRKTVQKWTGHLLSVKSVRLPGSVQQKPDYLHIEFRSVLLGQKRIPNFL